MAILENHEVLVRLLRFPNPGKVVYEDDYQVLVVERRRIQPFDGLGTEM